MSNNENTQLMAPARNALSALTEQLGLTNSNELYSIICNTIMPGNARQEEVAAFCMVAANYRLNPLAREIYAFPNKQGGVTPMVSIDGWLKLLHSNPDYDGEEFTFGKDEDGAEWCECAIFSRTKSRPTRVREYMEENFMKTSPVWQQRRKRMLRHRALIQAVRYFGGYAGLADRDEMMEAEMRNVTPVKEADWLGVEKTEEVSPAPAAAKAEGYAERRTKPRAQAQKPAPQPMPAPQAFEPGDEIPGLEEPQGETQSRVVMSADEFWGEEM